MPQTPCVLNERTLHFAVKGLGSVTGGQLWARTPMTIQQVFQLTGGFTAGIGLVILVLYHFTGKNWESNVVKTKEDLLIGATGILEFKDFDEEY